MTPLECVDLVAVMRAATPFGRWDEHTPDVWHRILADFDHADCEAVFFRLRRQAPYVDVSDIVQGVKELYLQRLADTPPAIPVGDPDDPVGWRAEYERNLLAVMRPHRPLEVTQ